MNYPNITQYKAAIQDSDSFDTLKDDINAEMHGYEPVFASGNFAVVFKMKKNQKHYALKCFLKDIEQRNAKQKEIVDYIENNPSEYFVDYKYLEDELWVDIDGGQEFPVTWMEWIEAPTLGERIKQYCEADNKMGLKQLAESFKEFALWILEQPFAHGDLKHDNILVKANGQLVLVDYDGMFVPTLSGQQTNELGGKCYQHPKRDADDFNRHLDDFSILIIYTSLLVLSLKPELYATYNNGQNIIFRRGHFMPYENNDLIQELEQITELEHLLVSIKSVLESDTISIANIKALIEDRISKTEYSTELQKAKRTIDSNYTLLENYNNSQVDHAIISKTLKAQKELTTSIFDSLDQKLKKLNTNEDNELILDNNPLTVEWWESLSETWKDIFLWNIELWEALEGKDFEVDPFVSIRRNCENALQRNHWYSRDKDITIILSSIYKLRSFFIDKDDCHKIKSLEQLRKLNNITTLIIANNKHDLKPISTLIKLNKLIITSNKQDLYPISNLINLTVLSLAGNWINEGNNQDLFPITKLKKLEELNLHNNNANIEPLAKLIRLIKLNLGGNKQDLTAISNLINITTLGLQGNSQDLHPINNLLNLKSLDLGAIKIRRSITLPIPVYKNGNTQDLKTIENLTKLRILDLSGNNNNLEPISKLLNLTELNLSGNTQNLTPISSLNNLTKLSIKSDLDIQGKSMSLKPIENLTKLRILDLTGNKQDLNPIRSLINLSKLYLGGNNQNLEPLEKLINLKELDLSYNEQDLRPISNLSKLNDLGLFGNKKELDPIESLHELQELVLGWNEQNLKPVSKLINLKKLDLSGNNADYSPISNLISLERLILDLGWEDDADVPISDKESIMDYDLQHYNQEKIGPIYNLIDRIKAKGGIVKY